MGECPEEIEAVTRNTGWKLTVTMEGGHIGDARLAEIVASIDRGVPAVVYDQGWNPAVAYGYEDSGRQLIVSDYSGGDVPKDVASLPPFALTVESFFGPPTA